MCGIACRVSCVLCCLLFYSLGTCNSISRKVVGSGIYGDMIRTSMCVLFNENEEGEICYMDISRFMFSEVGWDDVLHYIPHTLPS